MVNWGFRAKLIQHDTKKEQKLMLYTIAVVLLVLWLLGLVTSYTLGGVLHVLLVVAIVMFILGLVRGRG